MSEHDADDPLIVVPWRGGAEARVSRGAYEWIANNVPEAATAESRAALYELGAKLCALLRAGDHAIETEGTRRVAREKASTAVVAAWDALMAAMAVHPTYRGDQIAACERLGVDMAEAEKYAIALRIVIDGYRRRPSVRRGESGARGQHPGTRRAWLAGVAVEIQRALNVTTNRAAAITAGMAHLLGVRASADSIRLAMGARRL